MSDPSMVPIPSAADAPSCSSPRKTPPPLSLSTLPVEDDGALLWPGSPMNIDTPWVDPLPSDLDSLREELGVTYTNYRTGDEDVPVRRIYWTGRLQRDPKDRTKTDPTKPRRWQLLFNIASSTTRSVAVELQAPDASKPYTYVSLASNAHLDAEHTSGFADVSATCHPPLTVRRFLEDMLRDARLHQYALRKHTNLIGLRGRRFWLFRVLQELSDDQRRCLPQGTYSEFVVLADKCRGSPPRTSTPQLREQTSWRPHRRRSPYTPEALQYPPIRDGEFVANHAWKQFRQRYRPAAGAGS